MSIRGLPVLVLAATAACAAAPPVVATKQAWSTPSRAEPPAARPGPARLPPPAEGPLRTTPPPALARTSAQEPRVTEAMLPEGLRVVVVEHHRRPIASVRLVLARGARSDPPGEAGATWLAANLATDFREEDARGEREYGEKSLRRRLVDMGAAGGAVVTADGAILAVDGYAADLGPVLDLLGEAVISPPCGAESFKGRRDALLDAVEDVESGDPEALERVVVESAFGAGHPYARPARGTRRSLEPFGQEQAVARQRELFVPKGATLLVVGDVKPDAAIAAARKAFRRWAREAAEPELASPPPARPSPARSVAYLRRAPASTLVVCATRPLADVRQPDAALELFGALLGGSFSSRLSEVLREQHQLTYGVTAELVLRRYARALVVCAPLAATRAEEGVRLLRQALEGLRAAPPSVVELDRARAVVSARLETANEDVERSTGTWLDAVLRGQGRPRLAEERAAVAQVTPADLQAIARIALDPATLRWVVSGEPGPANLAARAVQLGPLVPYAPRD
ncbi:MAG: insulinase family protein [Anaeromyxobacteraceae bacterium]